MMLTICWSISHTNVRLMICVKILEAFKLCEQSYTGTNFQISRSFSTSIALAYGWKGTVVWSCCSVESSIQVGVYEHAIYHLQLDNIICSFDS